MPSNPTLLAQSTLDHVMIMVRDLDAASSDYGKLGFRVRSGGRLAGGMENTIVPFGIAMPYLELVGIYQTGSQQIRDNEDFLAQGEGAMYAGLKVKSAADVARRLRELGVNVPVPSTGTITVDGVNEIPPALWKDVIVPHGSSPRAEPLFFVESVGDYRATLAAQDPELLRKFDDERLLPHPNGAVALSAVWLAVERLDTAAAYYERLGASKKREIRVDQLEARAVEFALERGSLLLLESESPDGPIRRLLDLHQFGVEIPGVSIQVQNLSRALASMDRDVSSSLPLSQGPWGRSVIIPAGRAHGVWIELFEQNPAAG